MIRNDKQYQVTKARLREFSEALDVLKMQEMDPLMRELQEGAIQSQIEKFKDEIYEYEGMKNGNVNYVFIDSIANIHEALIKARIIKGWTQADLAKQLDLKEQQIQRYEQCNYSTASVARISQVAEVLHMNMGKVKVKVSEPAFITPPEVDMEGLFAGFNKMKQNGILNL